MIDKTNLDLANGFEIDAEGLSLKGAIKKSFDTILEHTEKQLSQSNATVNLIAGYAAGGTVTGYFIANELYLKVTLSLDISYDPKAKEELEDLAMKMEFAKLAEEMDREQENQNA